jgi:plastocyanin
VGISAGCNIAPGDSRPATATSDAIGPRPKAATPTQLASPEGGSGATEGAAPNEVVIDNFAYKPAKLVVKVGAKVTWVNRDDVPHTATSSTKPRAFDSGTLDTDGRFSHVFTAPGNYEYFCAVHPHMTGRVIVQK